MSASCEHSNPLVREGTTQVQRLLDALVPENVKLHELTTEDWMAFAKDYASLVNYYKLTDSESPDGDWEDFFPEKDAINSTLATYFDGVVQPHLALFISFLKLLAYPQQSLNGIPKRHLDFYYGEVLQLGPKAFSPDVVHIIFELAKNATSELVEKNSQLEAGKDGEGNPRIYAMDSDFVTNQAQVAAMHSIYTDEVDQLRYALQPNTIDGLEEPLEEDLTWSAFGNNQWPLVDLEIALAGEIFALKEGTRIITLNWTFSKNFDLIGSIYASLTTEAGWTEEIQISPDQINGVKNNEWTISVSTDVPAITGYQEDIHLKRINTAHPVLKLRFDNPDTYDRARNIVISKIVVTSEVQGATDLVIENVLGSISPDKPFMPFGPRPKKNAAMTIENEEFVGKQIENFQLNFNWLDVPPNLTNHYALYKDAIDAQKNNELNNSGYLIPYIYFTDDYLTRNPLVISGDLSLNIEPDPMREDFQLEVTSPFQSGENQVKLFDPTPQADISTPVDTVKGGEITVRLKESFYHDLFNSIYVSIITKAGTAGVEADALPNEPYTPLLDSLAMNYSATASTSFEEGDGLQLIHLNPFGSLAVTPETTEKTLLPNYRYHQFYIGLSKADARDMVSILFQVAEGSEDPALSSFNADNGIQWAVLTGSDNPWKSLTEEHIIQNTTNNFLRSGIIQFSLPKESASTNYLLDDGLIWLRAELRKAPEAIARFVGVHAQASKATFEDQGNIYDHLDAGLAAGEIKQLAQRKSKIKAVHQPYASYGGRNTETDNNFYRRISERLRHKDRALTIWDYEHLTLEAFPQIYKAKGLNHTKFEDNKVDELCPGHITLVVVPKVTDANTAFGLYPSVSQNTKDEIKNYLVPKQGLHVNLEVANPIYEFVQFDFKVRFYDGYDFNFYQGILKQDLTALLAPWAFDETAEIKFNNTLYEYDVINFIENLTYVDFLEEFKMNHIPTEGVVNPEKRIRPTNALAVLAPAREHTIIESEIC
jgi:hypothetical protein